MGQLSAEDLEILAEKWLNGSITPAERQRFDEWYEQEAGASIVVESGDGSAEVFRTRLLERIRASMGKEYGMSGEDEAGGWPRGGKVVAMDMPGVDGMELGGRPGADRRLWRIRAMAVAAAVLILVLGGWWWTTSRGTHSGDLAGMAGERIGRDIVPGRSGAILTLAGGRQIVLDSTVKGMVGTEGNSNVFNADGELAYKELNGKPPKVRYNTLTTDRGNEYRLTLPDGTRVWLNAASSIRYPTVFNGVERGVELTGEAYFEVRHREGMPFKVKVGGREIEDLGTHFDVNAYADDLDSADLGEAAGRDGSGGSALKTTLLEGSVKIGNVVLTPGEQARVDGKGRISVQKDADMEQAVAWKNGLFQFDHADLRTVMAEIGRWYKVDIRYEGGADGVAASGGAAGGRATTARRFGGKISRFSDAADVLKVLELSEVHFKIEHRTIIVMP